MAIKNYENSSINSEKLQANLGLLSKLLIMPSKDVNNQILINNCHFYFGNVLRVHWQ